MNPVAAAEKLIRADWEACRTPDWSGISDKTGLLPNQVKQIAEAAKARDRAKTAREPAAGDGLAALLAHPSPHVREFATKAQQLINLAVAAARDWDSKAELRARAEQLEAELADLRNQIGDQPKRQQATCPECNQQEQPAGGHP